MEPELERIVDEYMAIIARVHEKTQSIDAAIAVIGEIARDRRIRWHAPRKPSQSRPVTPNQLKLLKELGVECDPAISARDASQLIDEALEANRRQD